MEHPFCLIQQKNHRLAVTNDNRITTTKTQKGKLQEMDINSSNLLILKVETCLEWQCQHSS